MSVAGRLWVVPPLPPPPALDDRELSRCLWMFTCCAEWDNLIDDNERLVVYMGRVGRQDMDQVAHWSRAKMLRRCKLLSELVADEMKASGGLGGVG